MTIMSVAALDWIKIAREGGNVTRYHTRQLIKPQQNAHHSYNCAMIISTLAKMFEKNVDEHKLVMHMLIHDIPEIGIGDMPHYVKKEQPEIRELLEKAEDVWCQHNMPYSIYRNMKMEGFTEEEKFLVEFVDQFEPMFMMRDEALLGNREAMDLFYKMHRTCYNIVEKKRKSDGHMDERFLKVGFLLSDLLQDVQG